jgi:type III secretory pathway component EscV
MIRLFLKKFGGWIAAFFSILFGVLAIVFSAKKVGKAEAQKEAEKQRTEDNEAIAIRQINEAREASKKESETLEQAIDEQSKINSLNPGDAASKLRDEWSRD